MFLLRRLWRKKGREGAVITTCVGGIGWGGGEGFRRARKVKEERGRWEPDLCVWDGEGGGGGEKARKAQGRKNQNRMNTVDRPTHQRACKSRIHCSSHTTLYYDTGWECEKTKWSSVYTYIYTKERANSQPKSIRIYTVLILPHLCLNSKHSLTVVVFWPGRSFIWQKDWNCQLTARMTLCACSCVLSRSKGATWCAGARIHMQSVRYLIFKAQLIMKLSTLERNNSSHHNSDSQLCHTPLEDRETRTLNELDRQKNNENGCRQ